jgi:hypothetical protein
VDVVEVAAPEGLEALAQLAADPGGGRLGQLAEPGLLAQRLDIAHREPAHERADHHRPQRLGAQQLRAARKQLRDERLGRLADLRELHPKLSLGRLHPARAEPVAQPGGASGRRSYLARPNQASNSSSTARWMINLAPSFANSDSASRGFSPTPTASNVSICSSISADDGTVRLTA